MRSKIPSGSSRGQSMVEFALGISLALIILAGVLDLGRVFYVYIALRGAAQEGAVYGSLAPTDIAGIRERVRESSSTPIDLSTLANEQIVIQINPSACAGSTVTVTVQYTFTMAAPFMGGQTLTLTASSRDTILQPLC